MSTTENTAIQKLIEGQIKGSVREGVDEGVEDELNKVRSGNAGFKPTGIGWLDAIINFLAGIIFSIAEAFGFEKGLASLMGKHIPEETDKQRLADQITATTSRVLAEKGEDGKFKVLTMSPEKIGEAVEIAIAADIAANPELAKFMDAEQIKKAAHSAGVKISDKAEDIRAGLGELGSVVPTAEGFGKKIASEVSNGIEAAAADKILEALNKDGTTTWASLKAMAIRKLGNDEIPAAAEIMNRYNKDHGSVSKEEHDKAQHILYQSAVELKYAPDNAQREEIGKIAGKKAVEILQDPKNTDIPTEALAAKLQTGIEKALKDNQGAIDKVGSISVNRINRPYIPLTEAGDILHDVAAGFAEKTVKDDKGVRFVQSSLQGEAAKPNQAALDQATDAAKGAVKVGMTGSQPIPELLNALTGKFKLPGGQELS